MATASDHDLEDTLNKQFKGKILILRHPMGNESLRYDPQGKSLNQGREGDWTVYGAVQIKKIELGQNELRLQGWRLFARRASSGPAPFEFKRPTDSPRTPPVNPSVKVEIKTNEPLATVDQAQALLGNVFALNKDDLLDSMPEFWRVYLAAHLDDYDVKQGKEMEFKTQGSGTPGNSSQHRIATQPPDSQEPQSPLGTIYRVRPDVADVKAPKAKFTPEPSYTEAARYEKFQGVIVVSIIVDQTGKVRRVGVLRPLGLGLDESAVATLRTWSFDPAMHNGEPVSVEMNVEVSFNLY
jgi:TonB family protein